MKLSKKMVTFFLIFIMMFSTIVIAIEAEEKVVQNKKIKLNDKQKELFRSIDMSEEEIADLTLKEFHSLMAEPIVLKETSKEKLGLDIEKEVKRDIEITKNTSKLLKKDGYTDKEIAYLLSAGIYTEDKTSLSSINDQIEFVMSLYNEIDLLELNDFSVMTRSAVYYTVHGAVSAGYLKETGSSTVSFNKDVDFDSSLGYELTQNDYGYYTRLYRVRDNVEMIGPFTKEMYALYSQLPMSSYNYNVWGEIDFGSGRHHEGVDMVKSNGYYLRSVCYGYVVGRSDPSVDSPGDGTSYIAILDESTGVIIVYEHLLVGSNMDVGDYVFAGQIVGKEDRISYDSSMATHTHVEFHTTNEDHSYYESNPFSSLYQNTGSTLSSFYPYNYLFFYAYND